VFLDRKQGKKNPFPAKALEKNIQFPWLIQGRYCPLHSRLNGRKKLLLSQNGSWKAIQFPNSSPVMLE